MLPSRPRASRRLSLPYDLLLSCFRGLVAHVLSAVEVKGSRAGQLHFDFSIIARLVLKAILRSFQRLPEHGYHGTINFLVCLNIIHRSRTVLADMRGNVGKETSDCFEVQETDPIEFDVNRDARILRAVFPIRSDFDLADADLIVKHGICSPVGGTTTAPKVRKLGPRQFLQTPWTVMRVHVGVC